MSAKTIAIIAAAVLSLPILMCGGCLTLAFIAAPSEEELARMQEEAATEAESEPEASPAGPRLTAETYGQISEGMTYDQVVAIVGPPESELSSSDIGGIRTVVYGWKGGLLANANMTFQDGRLVSKAQYGL